MEKPCKQCGAIFRKPKKYSVTQWEKALYCSMACNGISRRGITHSAEARRKLSAAHKGTKKPWSGKYERTDAHRKAIAKGVRQAFSERREEIIKRLRDANFGKKKSSASRKRMRESWKFRSNYKGGEKTAKKRRCFYEKQRRIKKFGNGGSHTIEQWEDMVNKYDHTCPSCGKTEPEIKLTEDHIVPLSLGGSDGIENIQPLCVSCNSIKNNKAIRYEKKTKNKPAEQSDA